MQFIITAHDFPDALPRRMAVRQKHLDLVNIMRAEGKLLYAAALLNDNGDMAGSMMVCDFPDRAALDAYLAIEPYIHGKVWDKINIQTCKVPPSFLPE